MRLRLILVGLLGVVVGAMVALMVLPTRPTGLAPTAITTGRALVGGPFTLVRQDGQTVTDADFRGRYMLVYFGFTSCPDICPSTLQVMAAALDRLGPKAKRIVPVFITIDPERDTVAQLAKYVPSFGTRLVGLTGTAEQVRNVARSYRVYYQRVDDPKSTAGYTFDHSSILYLMDPKGAYVAHFRHTTSPDRLAEQLAKLL